MSPLFDSYLIVDWSANSTPKTGKDSIWWCLLQRDAAGHYHLEVNNPSTRHQALVQIQEILRSYAGTYKKILVGFDFCYAYPAGLAGCLEGEGQPSWRKIWKYLAKAIEDDEANRNNRFEVAGTLNAQLTGDVGPFWGCPASKASEYLLATKPRGDQAQRFAEFRLTELGNSTLSVWQLAYAGSVGSQVLLGLPYLYKLITAPDLIPVTMVWPFDTGLRELTATDLVGCNILHAEIYPSMIQVRPAEDEIRDEAQVKELAGYYADQDVKGRLSLMFAGRSSLTGAQRKIVELEEGWILGIDAVADEVIHEETGLISLALSLKEKELVAGLRDNLGLRIHRAISWVHKAEQEGDEDSKFVFLWIAFNAAYGQDLPDTESLKEKQKYERFFSQLVEVDTERHIQDILWKRYYTQVRKLIHNHHVFQPFWSCKNGRLSEEAWRKAFSRSKDSALVALRKNDVRNVLVTVFDRLYVLRNQIIHGGATWQSSVNREQVEHGAILMEALVPVVIDLMLANPELDWGEPSYPVVKD